MQSQPHGAKARPRRGNAELYLVPAGKPVWESADHIAFARRIFIFFDAAKLQRAGHNMAALQEISQLATFSDPVVRQLAAMLADETQQGGPNGRMYGESLAHALTAALLAITERAQKPAKGGLAPRALQRVIAYLEEHWREQLFLADLARLAGISQSHFGRAFKTSTGVAPSRWHMNIRIRRAQEMLLADTQSLADIALYAGFSDQSHFTRAFRQVAGLTPGAWRKAQQA
ncbi:AraC-like DNA-binding protein [Rhizomicrobium palustre]|uniref:AraC-like DNA-binding protein n=1 Tax=Rhizomicrobium palustre TaxID=189966 RepID=A0A846MUM4_9PROT|nr:AraC family transcriptional regulator [Rhizomicrobium palustre]NIK86780.1 AraC-like DNA-binding protein [Rhizomicrobium palustre]